MSNIRPDIAREVGETAGDKRDPDTEDALKRNTDTSADDQRPPATSEDELKETVRRQDEAGLRS